MEVDCNALSARLAFQLQPIAALFFFLGYGRCRTVAWSLHEHKQSKRHLYKDPEGPKVQANHNKPKTTQDTKTTRKSPSQICISSKTKTANQTHKGARAQTKTPTKRICQGTQRTYHCVTLKNMPKLIIHHYSLLRLWHVPKDLHQFVDQLNKQMNHRHMFSHWEISYDKFMSRVLLFFPVQRFHGFRQVVQHVLFHVAIWD